MAVCSRFSYVLAVDLEPGRPQIIEMPDCQPTMHAMIHGTGEVPAFTLILPDDYDPEQTYPLRVEVGENDGGNGRVGGVRPRLRRVGDRQVVLALVPLFRDPDRGEDSSPAKGRYLSYRDAPYLGRNFGLILERIFELVPNIDPELTFLGGFSNGGHAAAIMLTTHQEPVLRRIRHFYAIEGAVSHLADLFGEAYRDRSIFVAVGQQSLGRGLTALQFDIAARLAAHYEVDLHRVLMWGVGHKAAPAGVAALHRWLETIVSGGDRDALRREHEREWVFNQQLQVAYDAEAAVIAVQVANPFDAALPVALAVDAQPPRWPLRGGTQEAIIPAREKTVLTVALERDDDDLARLPAISLSGDRERDLTDLVAAAVAGSLPVPEWRAVAAAGPVGIDGRREEACWQGKPLIDRLYQRRFKRVIDVPAAVWVAYDAQALYMFVDCPEPNPDGVVAKQEERDGPVWRDDSVELWIRTSDDPADQYQFAVSITGALYDHRNRDAQGYNSQATVAVDRREDGWSLELAIPWLDLTPATGTLGDAIGLAIGRNRPQVEEGQGRFPVLPGRPPYGRLILAEDDAGTDAVEDR